MGTPTTIIGNASNKRGEFCLAKINLKSIHLFPYIAAKNDFDSLLVHRDDILEELLAETNDLKSFTGTLVATLVPNFFAIYYGQNNPHGDITNNEVKAKLLHQGSGYDLWGQIVEETLSANKLDNSLAVVDKAKKDPALRKKYISASYDPDSPTKLTSFNSPCGTIMNMQSNGYPQATASNKKFFIGAQLSTIFPQAMTQPGTFTFHLPRELEKESGAKKGITKLMLIYARGAINFKTISVPDITLATPLPGMEVVVLSQPSAT